VGGGVAGLQTKCAETSAIKHHTPGNNPKGYTQHSEHGESLKSRIVLSSLQIVSLSEFSQILSLECGTFILQIS
jgi:hypothetical protein